MVVHSIKDSFEKAMDISVEIRLDVDEQQHDKTFIGKSYIDDSDKV